MYEYTPVFENAYHITSASIEVTCATVNLTKSVRFIYLLISFANRMVLHISSLENVYTCPVPNLL